MPQTCPRRLRVVSRVDHSPGAKRALAWAAQEAGLRQAVLQVVHAYHAKELAAPFYFPSQHALPATTVGGAGEPAPQELAASMRAHAEFEQAYRGQAAVCPVVVVPSPRDKRRTRPPRH
jgi:nucleotide-binding universal stress UspA family protein